MIRYSSIDKDCIVLAHARYRGVKCIWWDKPRTGQAIMLHLRDFDSVQLEVWKAEDNPRLLLEQYRSSGWKNPTEVLSEMREGTDARKD